MRTVWIVALMLVATVAAVAKDGKPGAPRPPHPARAWASTAKKVSAPAKKAVQPVSTLHHRPATPTHSYKAQAPTPSLAEVREANRHNEEVRRIKAANSRSYDQHWSLYSRDQLHYADREDERSFRLTSQELAQIYRLQGQVLGQDAGFRSQVSSQNYKLASQSLGISGDLAMAENHRLLESTPRVVPITLATESPFTPVTVTRGVDLTLTTTDDSVAVSATTSIEADVTPTPAPAQTLASWEEALARFRAEHGDEFQNSFPAQPAAWPAWVPISYQISGQAVGLEYSPTEHAYGIYWNRQWMSYDFWKDTSRLKEVMKAEGYSWTE